MSNYVIHVPTWEDYLRLGIDEDSGISKNMWLVYEEECCVRQINQNHWVYTGIDYYKENKFDIITVDAYLKMQGRDTLKDNLSSALEAAEALEGAVDRGLSAAKENLDKKLAGGIPVGEMAVLSSISDANSVGDINSNEKGSGARYNSGKPDYSLIVIEDMLPTLRDEFPYGESIVFHVLDRLGHFQQTHERAYLYDILDAVGLESIEESAHVFTYGAKKYAAWNWTKGMVWSIPLACAVRHSLAILRGEEYDSESGRKHIGHVVCNIMMLIHYAKYYKEGNDLPPVEMFKEN